MFQNCESFQKATQMFYSMQYEEGLKLIDECIQKDPRNSIFYSNRALFYSQLGYVEEALADLNSAIELNYLNYIAYFNTFSLLMRVQKFDEAFQNLCCSLSCLYLVRAKTKKSELDASKSIKYAQNNMQAHLLKGLIHLQNGKYKLALNELDWACEINPSHEIVRNIRNLIFKKMNPGLPLEQTQNQNEEQDERGGFLRLQSSYTFEESEKEMELRDRILEFNEIYNNLNEYQGTITTKVPKQEEQGQNQALLEDQNQQILETQQHEKQNPPQIILESSASPNQQNEVEIQAQNVQITGHHKSDQQTHHQEDQQSCAQEINTNNETRIEDISIHAGKQPQISLAQQVAQKLHEQGVIIDGQIVFENHQLQNSAESFTRSVRQDFPEGRHSQAIVADEGAGTPSRGASIAPEPGEYATQSENRSLYDSLSIDQGMKDFHSINDRESEAESDKFSEFESMIHSHNQGRHYHDDGSYKANEENFQSFISESNHHENDDMSIISNFLYPRPENAMLQFSILKLEILDRSKEEVDEMKNLYCIANYLNVKEGSSHSNFKLRTACQKGLNSGTQWNQTFDPIEIPENPECMKIKVYNKKYSSYRDDLIGEMEVQITTHGLVKLPLFNKRGELSGSLFMNLELVFPPIEEVEETEEH